MRFAPGSWADVVFPQRPHSPPGFLGFPLGFEIWTNVQSIWGPVAAYLGQALLDHLYINISVLQMNFPDQMIRGIGSNAVALNINNLVEDYLLQISLCLLSIGLMSSLFSRTDLRCINSGQQDIDDNIMPFGHYGITVIDPGDLELTGQ